MAQQLNAAGASVALLVLLDCHAPHSSYTRNITVGTRVRLHRASLRDHGLAYVLEKLGQRLARLGQSLAARLLPLLRRYRLAVPRSVQQAAGLERQRIASHRASAGYRPQPYRGAVLLCRAAWRNPFEDDPLQDLGWGALASQLTVQEVPGDHLGILQPPHVQVLAALLDRHLS